MNRIDHRILVHATPQKVWSFLSDIENNPAWQVNCRELSFLTSIRSGQGTRWRMIDEGGRAYIIEITAWYNQLGYEYIIIDGSPYKHNQGRIRLQEIAEGTIIEWSFSYELGGLLSGVRNALLVRRNIENTIVDSLWTLWRQIGQAKDEAEFQAKSLMRDAPDVEERASYQPRHPMVIESTSTPIAYKADDNVPFIQEPPLTQDDTRPRPAVHEPDTEPQPTPPVPEPEQVHEPDFISGMTTSEFERISTPEKTSPEHMRATTIDPVNVNPPAEAKDQPAEDEKPKIIDAEISPFAPPRETPPVEAEPTLEEPTPSPTEHNIVEEAKPTAPEVTSVTKPDESTEILPKSAEITPKSYDKEDTSQISVFELFGLQKPSETQQMEAVKPDETQETPSPATSTVESPKEKIEKPEETNQNISTPIVMEPTPVIAESPAPQTITIKGARTGRRYILRQQLVQLRRPGDD